MIRLLPAYAVLAALTLWSAPDAHGPAEVRGHGDATAAVTASTRRDEARLRAGLSEAVARRFEPCAVGVEWSRVDSTAASLRDVRIEADGRVQLDAGGAWLPVRLTAVYDRDGDEVVDMRLRFAVEGESPAPEPLARRLDQAVAARLLAEFAGQPVQVRWDRTTAAPLDAGYVRVRARAIADFGEEGAAPVRAEGIWDTHRERWRTLDYRLGGAGVAADEVPDDRSVASS